MSMYNLTSFKKLSKEDQWNYFWEHAQYIGDYWTWNASYMLYTIEDYFVEIQFDILDGKAIQIRAFVRGSYLDKYVKSIKLDLRYLKN